MERVNGLKRHLHASLANEEEMIDNKNIYVEKFEEIV